MFQQIQDKSDQLVRVEALLPFRLNEGQKTRVITPALEKDPKTQEYKRVRDGEVVEIPLWLANGLANHQPPKIGPVTQLGKSAAARAAA